MLNPAFRRVCGILPKVVLGCKAKELVRNGVLSDSAIVRVVETGKTQTAKLMTVAKREVLATASPIMDDTGHIERIVCNLRNLGVVRQVSDRPMLRRDSHLVEEEHGLVARSPKMLDAVEIANDLALVDSHVLILGETGVGKDILARHIYHKSTRALTGSFVKVNCATIPSSLFESELFGYERGAFTGALKEGKSGLIEKADRGVLYLDEIGDLPLEQQAKLLSVVEDRQITRVGGVSPRRVDIRIIAATNRNLAEQVFRGRFREDLYYRIAVVPLYVPPLRERPEDIGDLLIYFQEMLSRKHGRKRVLSPGLFDFLCRYTWPGNVRELANLVESLVVIGRHEELDMGDLSRTHFFSGRNPIPREPSLATPKSASLKERLADYELEMVRQALERTSSNAEAARLLKTSLSTIKRAVRRLKGLNNGVGGFVFALQGFCTFIANN